MSTMSCLVCNREYEGKPGSLYCSSECFGKARTREADQLRGSVVKVCVQCGNPYTARYGQIAAFRASRFCSQKCAANGQQRSIDALNKRITIVPVTGCHQWTGYRNADGYGFTRFRGRKSLVHRVMWEEVNGPVPEGLQIDHICRNRACCNPKHLRVVTPQVNTLLSDNPTAVNARKPNCPKCGSAYTVMDDGRRYCKPCHIRKNTEYAKKRCAEDPEYLERRNEASRRYYEKRRTNPEAIQRGSRRPLNDNCPKCGGPYGTFPSGARYCMPCRKAQQAEYQQRYRAQQAKLKEKD